MSTPTEQFRKAGYVLDDPIPHEVLRQRVIDAILTALRVECDFVYVSDGPRSWGSGSVYQLEGDFDLVAVAEAAMKAARG